MGKRVKPRNRKKKVNSSKKTKHHIIPKSRLKGNIAIVPYANHMRYHELFSNMTPDEIIVHLVDKYWAGQEGWVKIAQLKLNARR